ncbi:MAG: hypothetical protein M3Q07_11280 [Pseudobdellovibrionaceae bacterium]|nr:hypothetical protein [Pseudobdellovibrionaceae bacterium]
MGKNASGCSDVRTIAKNLEPVTFDVLRNEATLANPICFSLSERVLEDIIHRLELKNSNSFPLVDDLIFTVRPIPELQTEVRVKFDASVNQIHINDFPLDLLVMDRDFNRLAVKTFRFSIAVHPSIGRTDITNFDLVFDGAQITAEDDVGVLDVNAILQRYPSIAAFSAALSAIGKAIKDAEGTFQFFLPTLISSIPLPDYWDQIEGFQISFDQFVYRDVLDDNAGIIGYLFLLFGVTSLNLPHGCFCPEEDERPDGRLKRSIQEPVPPTDVLMSLGISQDAIREIVSPFLYNSGATIHRKGGTLYGYVRVWVKTEPESVLIQDDFLEVSVSAAAGAEIKVGVKGRWIGKVEYGPGVSIKIEDVSGRASFYVDEVQKQDDRSVTEQRLVLNFLPTIGTVDVSVDTDTPADEVVDFLLGLVSNFVKEFLNLTIRLGKGVGLFNAAIDLDQTFLGFKFVEGYPVYRKNEALVIMLAPDLPRVGFTSGPDIGNVGGEETKSMTGRTEKGPVKKAKAKSPLTAKKSTKRTKPKVQKRR